MNKEKDVLKAQGYTHIDGLRIVSFVGILEDDEISQCLDCGHKGDTHAEYELEGIDEAEVVCPECGSLNYYVE
jgi:DNA-directed RNA polymerase subunit RPC12/RpoP